MTDPSLADKNNPLNLRRVVWTDLVGHLKSEQVSLLEVEDRIAWVKGQGGKNIFVERLTWTKVYGVLP